MKLILFSFFLFSAKINTVYSQATKSDPRDGEGWYSISLKLDFPKKWEMNLNYETRYYNNLKTYYGSYISIEGSNNLNKKIKTNAEYRISFLTAGVTHRYTLGMEVMAMKSKKIELNGRFLIQNRIQDSYNPLEENQKSLFWRLRGQVKFQLNKKVDIYTSVEPIMEIGANRFVDNWRNVLGTKLKLSDKTKLDVSYVYRPDFGKNSYIRYYDILCLNICQNIKINSKTKK